MCAADADNDVAVLFQDEITDAKCLGFSSPSSRIVRREQDRNSSVGKKIQAAGFNRALC